MLGVLLHQRPWTKVVISGKKNALAGAQNMMPLNDEDGGAPSNSGGV